MLEPELAPIVFNHTRVSPYQELLDHLIELTNRLCDAEGRTQTAIPFLTIIRNSRQTPPIPAVLTPAFCLILQGAKRLHFGENIIHCYPGEFLASVIDIPASAQIVGANKQSPYLGLRVDFTTDEIASVVTEAELKIKPKDKKLGIGAFIGKGDAELLELFARLLKLLEKPKESRFLSNLIKREMIFNLLSGEYGYLFFQSALFDQQNDGIARTIAWIKANYTHSFTVEELSKVSHTSVSGLHHKFKAVTTMGPLQYQKQLRLQEARRLMLTGTVDATTAATMVGYESPTQFNREYRRLFGLPPHRDIKAVRENPDFFTT